MEDLLDRDVRALLELFAGATPGPGVGSAAALVTAVAAALVGKVARMSRDVWSDAAAAAAQADVLLARASPLAQADADAYAAALEQLATSSDPHSGRRDFHLGRALEDAAAVPLRIAEVAADVCELAALVAAHGIPSSRPDAVGAAMLAEASARAAAGLVQTNLAVGGDEELARRCREAIDGGAAALSRALAADV